jgi:heme oxygenase (biliverdin-IX-beta and delta-forming)
MKIPIEHAVTLLHECGFGALATHSLQMPGYPFATVLPFVPDEYHRPVFLMSRLAEHMKNVLADARASFLLSKPDSGGVLAGPRVTIVGDVHRFEAGDSLIARYRRYHPDAEQYLAFGDFAFFRLQPAQLRMISGFGEMGWIQGEALLDAASFALEDEVRLIAELSRDRSHELEILGIDRFGLDVALEGRRQRQRFPGAPIGLEVITQTTRQLLRSLR